MTLLDAPRFDAVQDRRRRIALWSGVVAFFVLFIGFWVVSGRPVDWPWNWYTHLRGRSAISTFLKDVERNDLPAAYSVWNHDPDWQQHLAKYTNYPYGRFEVDWGHNSDWGDIKTHKITMSNCQCVMRQISRTIARPGGMESM